MSRAASPSRFKASVSTSAATPAARPSRLRKSAAASVVARPGCQTSVRKSSLRKSRSFWSRCAITRVEGRSEGRTELALRIFQRASAHEMRPQRQTLVRDVAQGQIELGVEIIDVGRRRSLEGDAVELNHRNQGARREADDSLVHMSHKRQIDIRLELSRLNNSLTHGRSPSLDSGRTRRSGVQEEPPQNAALRIRPRVSSQARRMRNILGSCRQIIRLTPWMGSATRP